MPIHKVGNGWKWGTRPERPTTKRHAQEIARAAYAHGYKKEEHKKNK